MTDVSKEPETQEDTAKADEAAKGTSEKAAIKDVTEGPAMDQEEDVNPVKQLQDLVDRCVNDNMQIHIVAQKVNVLNASFAEPIDDLDIIDLLVYAREELAKKNNGVVV